MPLFVGVDLGTTKIAAVVVDASDGSIVASAEAPNATRLETAAGRSEWDALAAVRIGRQVARRAIGDAPGGKVAGVGVTGQMHGVVLVSDDLSPLSPFVGWQDGRGDEPSKRASSLVDEMRSRAGDAAFANSGCRLATGFAGVTLYWLSEQGLLPPSGATAALLPDYFVASVCGQRPVTDPTNAGSSGVFDVVQRRWDQSLLQALGLPESVFPEVRPAGAVVGALTREAAAELGLSAGVPVVNALGDNQASFLGSVADHEHDLLVNVGTGAQVSAISRSFAPSTELETRAFVGERYLLAGNELAGGSAYAALRDFVRLAGQAYLGAEAAALEPADLYERLNALAASAPAGCDGLACDTRLAGTRAEPSRRGGFSGLGFANFTPGHFARAILEGLAERFHALYGAMLANGLSPRGRLVGSGNGIKRNPLLGRILAERFEMPLVTPRYAEEAAYGAALLAAVGTDEIDGFDAIGRLIRYQQE